MHLDCNRDRSTTLDALIVSCCERVKAMAWKFARSASHVDAEDMYSIGMLAVCEAGQYAYKHAAEPLPYLCKCAKYAMIGEWRRLHGWSTVSLDAPLTDDRTLCLADLLPAPVPVAAASAASSKRVRALHGAMRRLTSRRQRAVLRRRYGLLGYGVFNLKETAHSQHTSVDAVDQTRRYGLRKLAGDARLRKVMGVSV